MDEPTPGAAHRREIQQQQARGHHAPARRDPYVDPEAARDRALDELAEEIRGIEDELAAKRAEYERVSRWEPPPVAQPAVDARTFPTAGTDAVETWRSPKDRSA